MCNLQGLRITMASKVFGKTELAKSSQAVTTKHPDWQKKTSSSNSNAVNLLRGFSVSVSV